MPPKKQLGQILLEEGLLDEFQLKSALGYQKKWGGRLGKVLVENHFVTEDALVRAVHRQTGVEIVDIANLEIPDYLLRLVPLELANRHNLIPVRLDGEAGRPNEVLVLAMSDPTNLEALDEVRFRTGKRTAPVLAGEGKIQAAIRRWYLKEAPEEFAGADGSAAPAVALSNGGAEEEMIVVRGTLETPPGQPAGSDFDPDDPFAQLESLAEEAPASAAATPVSALTLEPAAAKPPLATPATPPPAAPATPTATPPATAAGLPVLGSPEALSGASEVVPSAVDELPELEVIDVEEPEDLQPDPGDTAAGVNAPSPDVSRATTADAGAATASDMNELLSRVGLSVPSAGSQPAPVVPEPVKPAPEPVKPAPPPVKPVSEPVKPAALSASASPTPITPAPAIGPAGEQQERPPVPTDSEVGRLLERLEGERDESALPHIIKPSNMVAAIIRLLLDKGVFTEAELLDELKRQ